MLFNWSLSSLPRQLRSSGALMVTRSWSLGDILSRTLGGLWGSGLSKACTSSPPTSPEFSRVQMSDFITLSVSLRCSPFGDLLSRTLGTLWGRGLLIASVSSPVTSSEFSRTRMSDFAVLSVSLRSSTFGDLLSRVLGTLCGFGLMLASGTSLLSPYGGFLDALMSSSSSEEFSLLFKFSTLFLLLSLTPRKSISFPSKALFFSFSRSTLFEEWTTLIRAVFSADVVQSKAFLSLFPRPRELSFWNVGGALGLRFCFLAPVSFRVL